MKTIRRWQCLCLASLGLASVTLTGCQTNVAGMTLPSGYYLNHPPQYIPPSPAFPLSRELAGMEAQNAGVTLPQVVTPPPAPVTVPPPPPAPLQPDGLQRPQL
jgi:hypothetical protein